MCGPNQGTPISGGAQIGPVSAPGLHTIPVEALAHPAQPAPSPMAAAMSAPLGNVGSKAPVATPPTKKFY